jgi:hypothetical protein
VTKWQACPGVKAKCDDGEADRGSERQRWRG